MAIQSNENIVVAGSSYNGSDYDFAVVRYDSGWTPPVTTVLGNGVTITDGDATPSTSGWNGLWLGRPGWGGRQPYVYGS